jgi:class 3 adenylate cyclase
MLLFFHRRNTKVVDTAERSNAIVSSLFPSNVRERLFNESTHHDLPGDPFPDIPIATGESRVKSRLRSFMTDGGMEQSQQPWDSTESETHEDIVVFKSKPIADLFPETTILFADISGFTAWSSMREPAQVFVLLETIYNGFDHIARRRRVYKVETIGDCYVAVCGLPDPRKDHAVVMARFARDCLARMRVLVTKLEVILGPDTAELAMRFVSFDIYHWQLSSSGCRSLQFVVFLPQQGLHSGPVTAGVLRGERSRFQLFGDTMNTASRMESTGLRDKIHLSQETADQLVASGKRSWVVRRDDKVIAKGKGELQTYWLTESASKRPGTVSKLLHASREAGAELVERMTECVHFLDRKTERLVLWHVEVQISLLRQLAASRRGVDHRDADVELDESWSRACKPLTNGTTVLDEVREIIHLPDFSGTSFWDTGGIQLDIVVEEQLTDYVSGIACMYRDNPFHNFEHASHVTMSVAKLLSRIVTPELDERTLDMNVASTLHDFTYGITSDPLTQFACIFSALVHDVGHPGVPNTQLVKENEVMAEKFRRKSVAEQNSVDLAWNMLLQPKYAALRSCIAPTIADQQRFRQLVVNSVMATDVLDADLKSLRNARWEAAFSSDLTLKEPLKVSSDRKATIVIEHMIQASDVAHTMQHWHVYRRWNENLFEEMYQAYVDGRGDVDPSINWYESELGFFDFYVIPLAKKLKDCGVFGVSSSEYLDYAAKNRQEWESRGEVIIEEMIQRIQRRPKGEKPVRRRPSQ